MGPKSVELKDGKLVTKFDILNRVCFVQFYSFPSISTCGKLNEVYSL